MSDDRDSNDKIHRLFPAGEQPSQEEDAAATKKDKDQGEEDAPEAVDPQEGEDDKVVRPNFGESKDEGKSIEDLIRSLHEDGKDANRAKFQIFSRMVAEGMVMVTLDPRPDEVRVPDRFKAQSELRLNFSHGFQIPDFDYDEEGVGASLSFDGKRQRCDIPWEKVYMLYSHESGKVVVFAPRRDDS